MDFPDWPFDDDEAAEPSLQFHFEDVAFDLPNQQQLSAWLFSVATAEQKPMGELNYIFCSDEYLRQINVEYLQHDYYTDVITFPYSEAQIHGDVFISSERVADNARALGTPFERELYRVMVHGVLHLAGHGDKTEAEAQEMRKKEDFYLRLI